MKMRKIISNILFSSTLGLTVSSCVQDGTTKANLPLTATGSLIASTTSVNGTGSSLISNPQTSRTYVSVAGSGWTQFTVDLGADFLGSNICTGATIFGRPGSATCSGITTTTTSVDGSGASAITSPATSKAYTPTAGSAWTSFTIDLGADFLEANICNGSTIFGKNGSATCGGGGGGSFGDFVMSNAYRDVGTTQQTLTDERDNGVAAGHRYFSDVTKDDDGYYQSSAGGSHTAGTICTGAGGSGQTCSTAIWLQASRPSVNCGSSGSVSARISDCATANPSNHTWSGENSGLSGEGTWSLVTKLADTSGRAYEVWRDDRTKLLWSDRVGNLTSAVNQGQFNWCLAAGNSQGSTGLECRTSTASSYNNMAISLCGDDGAGPLTVPDGVNDVATANGLTYWGDNSGPDDRSETDQNSVVRAKGNLSSIAWRLPTRSDYMQAIVNGMQYVLPNIMVSASVTGIFWTSTIVSSNRAQAWTANPSLGRITEGNRLSAYGVRCVGVE